MSQKRKLRRQVRQSAHTHSQTHTQTQADRDTDRLDEESSQWHCVNVTDLNQGVNLTFIDTDRQTHTQTDGHTQTDRQTQTDLTSRAVNECD